MREPIGFIGLGTIGGPMANRLVSAGHDVLGFDLDPAATGPLVEAGARAADSVAQVGRECTVVFTSLPGPDEVEAVVLGTEGLLSTLDEGGVHVDLTTNSIDAVRALAAAEAEKGISFIDAPVSGGAIGATQGTLTVMASGPRAAFDRVEGLMGAFASTRFHLGESGNGTLVKLINNAVFLGSGLILQEGFVMAAKAGLDVHQLMEILKKSSGAVYAGLAGLLLGRNFENVIFKLGIAAKDLSLATRSGEDLEVEMPVTRAAAQLYARAVESGLEDEGFVATIKALEALAGVEVPPVGR